MITGLVLVVTVLGAGVAVGVVLAYRLFHSGASTTSRRAIQQLRVTLEGLESAYSMKVATFEAQRELAQLSGLASTGSAESRLHLPRSGAGRSWPAS